MHSAFRLAATGIAAAGFAWFAAAGHGAEPASPPRQPQRMMFVGNSLTEYNGGVAQHVRLLAQAADKWNSPYYQVAAITTPGAYLFQHEAALAKRVRGALPWDVVVLQGQSHEPVDQDPSIVRRFHKTVADLDRIIKASGSSTALFMTWGTRGTPGMSQRLVESYAQAGRAIGAPVIPVGLAFERAMRSTPSITLHESDGLHPTAAGTYLAACVFYASFQQRSPEGNPYHAQLAPEAAASLQATAWATVRDFRGW